MGLFGFGGRRSEFLNILRRERQKYMELFQIKKKRDVQNAIKVILSFIDDVTDLIKGYYKYDSKTFNKRGVFRESLRAIDTHITSIIAYINKCGLNGRKVARFWRGKNIGHIDVARLNERDVRNFVYNIRYLLDYLYKSLKRV